MKYNRSEALWNLLFQLTNEAMDLDGCYLLAEIPSVVMEGRLYDKKDRDRKAGL